MGLLDSLFPSTEADPLTQTSPADMQTLALGKALEQIQQTGRQRTAGPMGSIAQNLMPLFGAMVQAKAAQAQAVQSAQQDRLNQLLTLAKIGELGRQGGGEGPKTAEQGAVQAQLAGEPTDPWTELQGKLHPQKPAADTTIGLVKQSLGEKASDPKAVLDALAKQKQAEMQGTSDIVKKREQDVALFKQTLPKNLTDQQKESMVSGNTLLGLLGDAERVIATIPKDMSDPELAGNLAAYQTRSEHPEASNRIKSWTGGLANFDNDSRIDEYASWVGQVQSALSKFNVQGRTGGIQLINFLQKHFPNYGDNKTEALHKAELLRNDKGIIQRRLQAIMDEMNRESTKLDAPGASRHPAAEQWGTAWMARPGVDKNGNKANLWLNPDTGETRILPPDQLPEQLPDLGIR